MPYDSCDCYTVKDRNWIEMKSLLNCRQYPSSARIRLGKREVMVVAGGLYEYKSSVKQDVELFDGGQWVNDKVAQMPVPLYRHCLVKLNDTQLLAVGGRISHGTDNQTGNSYFYNALENKWTTGPGFIISFFLYLIYKSN